MQRRVARSSRSRSAANASSVTVVAGSIRTPDDPTPLDIKLSIWETEITMRADGAELGHWPAESVTVNPIDAFSFEFSAEGDRLIFTPRNPDEFRELPIVAGSSKKKRKRTKTPKVVAPTKELRWDETTEAEVKARKKAQPETRASLKEKRAAAKAAKKAAAKARKTPIAVVDYDAAPRRRKAHVETAPASPAPVESAKVPEVVPDLSPAIEAPAAPERSARSDADESSFAELRHRLWMTSLDFARKYDLFGLDRVPVSEGQGSDPNHTHTWDHRVAPSSGPSSFICTACGAFKKRG